jgi:DNA-binding NtrC family response regulator
MRLVDKIGHCRWPVLLLGETGTGKEVIARTIHNVEPSGPFVTVDCSALVSSLMESELFGHTRGSFTGAIQAKLGLIETAHGGTVFLDEIGELPLETQSKLLRVLQQKEFRPVGSNQQRKVDFRVIAATNRDLAKEVERGNFRRDLFYRINVVTLRLAPLRDRKEDIPSLIQHFVSRYGTGHEMDAETLELMVEYPWPGNIRELENCVQHMVAIAGHPLLTWTDLPSPIQNFIRHREPASLPVAAAQPVLVPAQPVLVSSQPALVPTLPKQVMPLDEVERRAILEALHFTRGDRSVAATLLGIGRTTLYRKLREYHGIGDDRFRQFFRQWEERPEFAETANAAG